MNTPKAFPGRENNLKAKAYLTEAEVAERLCISPKWLQKMRHIGGGIPYCKFGSAVRYPLSEVVQFEEAAIRASTSDPGKNPGFPAAQVR